MRTDLSLQIIVRLPWLKIFHLFSVADKTATELQNLSNYAGI
jgi:hypothetical protein